VAFIHPERASHSHQSRTLLGELIPVARHPKQPVALIGGLHPRGESSAFLGMVAKLSRLTDEVVPQWSRSSSAWIRRALKAFWPNVVPTARSF